MEVAFIISGTTVTSTVCKVEFVTPNPIAGITVMTAVPTALPVIVPSWATVATDSSEEVHSNSGFVGFAGTILCTIVVSIPIATGNCFVTFKTILLINWFSGIPVVRSFSSSHEDKVRHPVIKPTIQSLFIQKEYLFFIRFMFLILQSIYSHPGFCFKLGFSCNWSFGNGNK